MAQKLLHYDVLERLGQGARSVIYAVSDPKTHKTYALKHVVRQDKRDNRFIEQMQTEYEIGKGYKHPNLRRILELRIVKTMFFQFKEAFLVMEMVEGRALDVRLPSDMVELCDTFVQAASGLSAMHTMGFVHCDIKPNNIIRGDDGKVCIIDYGQSCRIGTIKDRIQGTPDYIAPEQVHRRPVTPQTDVFNLGATMYWAFTGGKHIPTLYKVNKQGDNSFLLDETFEPPQAYNPKIPAALSNLIMECIATNPKKRPQDMKQLGNRIQICEHILLKTGGAATA